VAGLGVSSELETVVNHNRVGYPPSPPFLLYRVRKLLKGSEMAKSWYGIYSEMQMQECGDCRKCRIYAMRSGRRTKAVQRFAGDLRGFAKVRQGRLSGWPATYRDTNVPLGGPCEYYKLKVLYCQQKRDIRALIYSNWGRETQAGRRKAAQGRHWKACSEAYSTPLMAQMSPPCGWKRSNITHFPSGDQTG